MQYAKKAPWILLIILLCSNVAGAADPFYTSLLQQGARDFRSGRLDEAVQKLRIACFGLLDDPPLLTEGLVRLSVAQAEAGDRRSFLEVFDRIVEVEELFDTYSAANIPEDLRRAFEERAQLWVPPAELGRVANLQPSHEQTSSAIGGDSRISAEEDLESPEALLRQAQQKLATGKPAKARPFVDRLLTVDPQNDQGRCLHGRIGHKLKSCAEALDGLPRCPELRSDIDLAGFYLQCLVDTPALEQARDFERSLDDAIRTKRRIARLASKLPPIDESDEQIAGSQQTATADSSTEEQQRTPDLPATEPEPETPSAPTPQDRESMGRIRNLAHAAASLAELEEPLRMATELADAYPESQQAQFLAAEIAYRGSLWTEAVRFFKRAGPPSNDQPLLKFYMAVSLYETGFGEEAAAALTETLPALERTDFVESYAARILNQTDER